MFPRSTGVCAVIVMVLEWSYTSSSQNFGIMDIQEFDHLGYVLEIARSPVTTEVAAENSRLSQQKYLSVMSKSGQEYSCSLPSRQSINAEDMTVEADANGSTSYNVSKLLDPLSQMCLFLKEGWWTYRYCHGQHVSQFHVEAGEIEDDIIYLGYFQEQEKWDGQLLLSAMKKRLRESSRASKLKLTSHDVFYTNGTLCGLTGKARTTTAKLICSQADVQDSKIVKITEGVTCNYSIIIHTPFLCDHPAFKPRLNRDSSPIVCSPVVSEQQYDDYWEEERASQAKKETKPDVQVDESEHTPSTHKTRPTNKPVSLSVLLESLAHSIAGKIEADVRTSDTGKLDDSQLEDLIDDYVKESIENVFDGSSSSKQFLVEKFEGNGDDNDNEEQAQTVDQLPNEEQAQAVDQQPVEENLASKESKSSLENGMSAGTNKPEVATASAGTDPKETSTKGQVEVLLKVYQVEIDPDQEIDPENLQDLLVKGEEEGNVHEVKLDLTSNANDHSRNSAFMNTLFGELLGSSADSENEDNPSTEKKKQADLEEAYRRKWKEQHKRDKPNKNYS